MTILCFSTKAETLLKLQREITTARISPLKVFSVREWRQDSDTVIREIQETLSSDTVIVRSSSSREDSHVQSLAGAFLSIPDVDPTEPEALKDAINRVIASYGEPIDKDQFFVQEQVINVAMSGVMFTRDQDTLAQYYIINYDDLSGSTDSVTSGFGSSLKTYVRAKCSPYPPKNRNFASLVLLAEELEGLFQCDALDIEFAILNDHSLYLLQTRPIASGDKKPFVDDERFPNYLRKIENKASKLNGPHPGLCGSRGMYSIMTDWNPAEIIGARPRMLALSLYKELITDGTWAYQRDNYGYRTLRSYPLLVSFLGRPYIDVRVSLNSFVPKALSDDLAEKLVDYYLSCLESHPHNHDKVEFNIVYSCYFFGVASNVRKLLDAGFTELDLDRIKYSLLDLTNAVIDPKGGLYRKDLLKVEELARHYDRVLESPMPVLDKIYWLIQDCKRYGTLPFAGLARAGFMAVQMLRSFIDVGIISENEYQKFMNSLNTVAAQLTQHSQQVQSGALSREAFLSMYGHLRPGTYDILSRRYDEAFEDYFEQQPTPGKSSPPEATFVFSQEHKNCIQKHLDENGLKVSPDNLLQFIVEAIEGREYSKFLFTRSLSEVLRLVESLGQKHNISRNDLANLDVKTLLSLYSLLTHENLHDILMSDIEKWKAAVPITNAIQLPQLIRTEREVYDFHIHEAEPNFVTLSRVTEVAVDESDIFDTEISNKIVFIRSADPGYDWIFSRNIAGLVTMYGGVNSHMAIRCAELQIPAVIGCGEKLYSLWSDAKKLEIDCANKQVRPIN